MGIGAFGIPLAIYLGGVVVALLTIFKRNELGLMYLVLFLPLQNVKQKMHIFPLGNNFYDILIIALIIGWFVRKNRSNGVFERTSVSIPIVMYIVITFIGLLWGYMNVGVDLPMVEAETMFKDWKNLILLPILFFITLNSVVERKWVKLILLTGVLSIFLTACFFYREYRWFQSEHYSHAMRVSGPFSYLGPNELGAFFAQYGVLLCALFLCSRDKWERMVIGGIFAMSVYCLMYSFSRAGYLAIVLGLGFVFLFKSRKLLIALIIFVILAPGILPESVMQRIEMTTLSEDEKIEREGSQDMVVGEEKGLMLDSSSQGRFGLWEKGLEMFKSNPVLGTGYRTYSHFLGFDTHNNYVKVLAEQGIIGFSIYIILYYLAFRSGWGLYRKSKDQEVKGLGLGFAGCVVANIVVNTTHDNWSYINVMGLYWVLWGLVVRSRMIMERDLNKEGDG